MSPPQAAPVGGSRRRAHRRACPPLSGFLPGSHEGAWTTRRRAARRRDRAASARPKIWGQVLGTGSRVLGEAQGVSKGWVSPGRRNSQIAGESAVLEASSSPAPLPQGESSMVRRGSTVRVRQRALVRGNPRKSGFLLSNTAPQSTSASPSGGLFGSLRGCNAPANRPAARYLGAPPYEGGDRQSSRLPRRAQNRLDKRQVARTGARGARSASLGIGFGDAPLAAARLWGVSPVNDRKFRVPPATASRGVSRVAHDWRSPAC